MYELIIKILGEKDLKRYTIKEIQEMKEILKDVKTEEVKLRRLCDVRAMGEKKTDGRKGLSL